jgi:hypothetical protein
MAEQIKQQGGDCVFSLKVKTCPELAESRSTSMTTLKLFYFVLIGQLPLISNEGEHDRIETNRFADNGSQAQALPVLQLIFSLLFLLSIVGL